MFAFGSISNPFCSSGVGGPLCAAGTQGEGIIILSNSLLKFFVVIAGIYALLNFIIAGYLFLNAGGEPKNVTRAWDKIWQSLVGLLLVAGTLVLGAIVGQLIFGNSTILLNPNIYSPQ